MVLLCVSLHTLQEMNSCNLSLSSSSRPLQRQACTHRPAEFGHSHHDDHTHDATASTSQSAAAAAAAAAATNPAPRSTATQSAATSTPTSTSTTAALGQSAGASLGTAWHGKKAWEVVEHCVFHMRFCHFITWCYGPILRSPMFSWWF